MDDFNVSSLHESKNEWGSRLLTILTPHIVDGLKSIFDEAIKLCKDNNEMDKYLMTFQNFITRIPKWNPTIIESERLRIVEKSGCNYLEDLVTCVHIIQLKLLTAIRAGQKQRKIDISIPKLDDFIHKVYINVARKIYKNVYLFEINIPPLQIQKHFRETEIIVQECILNTVRESIPVESILQAYMGETIEEDVVEEIKEQVIEKPAEAKGETQIIKETGGGDDKKVEQTGGSLKSDAILPKTLEVMTETEKSSRLSFNDVDYARDENNNEIKVEAPKNIERLEEISEMRNEQRRLETEEDDDFDNPRLKIADEDVKLDELLDIHNIDTPNEISLMPDLLIDDIEVLA
uniref:Uncharacterized protein n=1 Tax=viral metagenome TaxID=1070528 RepID=A0A6C0BX05_9ZZZZ